MFRLKIQIKCSTNDTEPQKKISLNNPFLRIDTMRLLDYGDSGFMY